MFPLRIAAAANKFLTNQEFHEIISVIRKYGFAFGSVTARALTRGPSACKRRGEIKC
jgi:hypothetical protein